MRLKNEDVRDALAALNALCAGGNRLPTLAALRADRTRAALAAAWAPAERRRQQLLEDAGATLPEGAQHFTFPTPEARKTFEAQHAEMMPVEVDVEVQPITMADLAAGWYRTEAGKKEPLDLAPLHLGALVRLGLVLEQAPPAPGGDG